MIFYKSKNDLAMDFLRYRHTVNLGDLVSSLPGIKHLYEITGRKAIIYQQLNRPGEYFLGATHPTVNERGEMVCFNVECYEKMKPLLLSQEYIEDFQIYEGQTVDYDLDVVRHQIYCGAPHFPLHKWTWMAYPEMTCDLSEAWLSVEQIRTALVTKEVNTGLSSLTFDWFPINLEGMIIINFTERYRNYNINYFFLKQYENWLVFAGTKDEKKKFCNQWGLKGVLHLKNRDLLELAQAIKSCKFFIGNQSLCWHLAQAMHVPRILELYPHAQNCTNFGANGYEFYHQPQLEYLVGKLVNS